MTKTHKQATFGDFQTPLDLARRVVAFIAREESHVGTTIEPTCGVGGFLRASAEIFGKSSTYWGFDINPEYVKTARAALNEFVSASSHVEQLDFYAMDWRGFFSRQPPPLLVIGNLPWITNAAMGSIGGQNLPEKTNFQKHRGFAAKTGKANFDISEWMLIRLLEALQGMKATVAMLCKTSTARKVLRHMWVNNLETGPSSLHLIDATAEFGVSVDACLLYTHTGFGVSEDAATVYRSLSYNEPLNTFGLFSGELVSDINTYSDLRELEGIEYRRWRSGVKHDAARVMEFTRDHDLFVNGLGEHCDLEEEYIYPLLKSSDLANGRLRPRRFVLITQRRVGDPTDTIKRAAPKTWRYLVDHAKQLDSRGSSIYANRARFSVFGVGNYSFSEAKVAISGFYKNLCFHPVGLFRGKPIMVDDTCYFIPCDSMSEAEFFSDLLNSATAQRFISALVFTDAKRPITIDVLKRIDLKKLADHSGVSMAAAEYLAAPSLESGHQGLLVFERQKPYRTQGDTSRRKARESSLRGK